MSNILRNNKEYIFILDGDNVEKNLRIAMMKELNLFSLIGNNFIYRLSFDNLDSIPPELQNKEVAILIDKKMSIWNNDIITKNNVLFESEYYLVVSTKMKLKYLIPTLKNNIYEVNLLEKLTTPLPK